ncbi:MAG: hypothetical protein GY750_00215 [Lentisphaerae bacterium]|nr:hypothetical protein [Lentisphaerota bacterium]MCP4099844.1 hypothetical protein [Lentisphaerota bacterium]
MIKTKIHQESINNKRIYIADNHHEVLPAWEVEHKNTGLSPALLTLDHHTDNLKAFLRAGLESDFSGNTAEAIKLLRHDEHIDYALCKGWISYSVIFSHVAAANQHSKIKVVWNPATPPYPTSPSVQQEFKNYADQVLENSFLQKRLESAFSEMPKNFILDIDLDYFHTTQSINPKNCEIFYKLIQDCEIITISREDTWVNLLRLEGEMITSDSLQEALLKHIDKATR